MGFFKKHILDISGLSCEEISLILDTAEGMKEISQRSVKKVPVLKGRGIVFFFSEPSTRTRLSFEMAAKRLSADTVSIGGSGSSMVKGETLIDTVKNIQAMNPDIIVIRHSSSGAALQVANHVKCSVVNAGDGTHAHPSQALLDMMTIRQQKGGFEGLNVAIVGDIAHSRVARSDVVGLSRMGAHVRVCGPGTMLPPGIEELGCQVVPVMEDCVTDADVIIMLRIQKERQERILFPDEREYARLFGLNQARISLAHEGVMVMHPGPLNRGVEIESGVADRKGSVILDQVTNGVALRMALFYMLTGGVRHENSH